MLKSLGEILNGTRDFPEKVRKIVLLLASVALGGSALLVLPQGRQLLFRLGAFVAGHPLGNHDLRNWMFLTGGIAGVATFWFVRRAFLRTEPKIILPEKDWNSWLLIIGYAVIGIWFCTLSDSVWDDEFLTVNTVARPWGEIIPIAIADVHPPLYFLLLKAFTVVAGHSIFSLKLFSVIPAILTMILLAVFLKKEFSPKAAFFSMLSFVAAASNCHYFVEVRMYTWTLFFVSVVAVSIWYLLQTNKLRWWFLLFAAVECAAYSHYYAAAGVGIGGGLLFLWFLLRDRKRLLPVVLFAIAALLAYLPWVPHVLETFSRTGDGNFWTVPMRPLDALACFTNYFWAGGEYLTPFFAILAYATFGCFFLKKEKAPREFFAVAAFACTALLAIVCVTVSLCGHPIFATRYFYPISGMVWLFFGVAAASIQNRRLTSALTALLAGLAFASLSHAAYYEWMEGKAHREFRSWLADTTREGPLLKADDVLIFPSGKSVHEVRNISHFFPQNVYVATGGDEAGKWFGDDFYKMFGPRKITMAAVADSGKFGKRGAWIFKMLEGDAFPNLEKIPEARAQLMGTFGWGGGAADGYKFRLYYVESAAEFARMVERLREPAK